MSTIRTLQAKFPSSNSYAQNRTYDYLVPEGDNPEVGDIIVTSMSLDMDLGDLSLNRYPLRATLALVTDVHDAPSDKAVKFYIQLIKRGLFEETKKRNKEHAERQKKRKVALSRLQSMMQEKTALEMYRKLAETNPEAAEYLKVLEE